jgi:hypothetical protein
MLPFIRFLKRLNQRHDIEGPGIFFLARVPKKMFQSFFSLQFQPMKKRRSWLNLPKSKLAGKKPCPTNVRRKEQLQVECGLMILMIL